MRTHDDLNIKALVMLVLAVIFAVIIFLVAKSTNGAISSKDTDETGVGIQTEASDSNTSKEEKSISKSANTEKLENEPSINISKHEKAGIEHKWYSWQYKKTLNNTSSESVCQQHCK